MKDNNLLTPEEILEDNGYDVDELGEDGMILFRNPDYTTALVGVSHNNEAVYDYELMLDYLVQTENMSYEDAADFISYDTLNAIGYMSTVGKTPVVLFPFV